MVKSSSGRETGNGLKRTASSSVKIVAFAPMPSASVAIAAVVNPGVCHSERVAYLTSWNSVSSIVSSVVPRSRVVALTKEYARAT
jgi:hypothetical protein